jgi:hypothetical protein
MNARSYTLRGLAVYTAVWGVALACFAAVRFPVWSLFTIAGLGALLGTPWLLGGTRAFYSIAWGMPLTVVGVSVMALTLKAVGSYLSLSGEVELKGASYRSFTRAMDTSRFDPIGAADIYYYARYRRDRSMSFYRMSIGSDALGRLLATTPASWDGRNRPCAFEPLPASAIANPLSGLKDQELLEAKPHWWKPSIDSSSIVGYMLGCDDGRGLKPLPKAVWLYDTQTRLLWIATKAP